MTIINVKEWRVLMPEAWLPSEACKLCPNHQGETLERFPICSGNTSTCPLMLANRTAPGIEMVPMDKVEEILERLIQKHPEENSLLRAQYEIRHLHTYEVNKDGN